MHISISIDTTLQNHVVALNRPLCSGCGFASLCIDRDPRGVGITSPSPSFLNFCADSLLFLSIYDLVAIFFGAIERFLYRSNSPTSKNFPTVLTCECANIITTKHNTT